MLLLQEMQNARILIVDDQEVNVLLLEKLLKGAGYKNLKSTTDSREVTSIYSEFKPDLILLDLFMPHLDGFQVMEELKKIEKEIFLPILVLTALTEQAVRVRALVSGAKDFLSKPFDRAEVLNRIRNLLEVRLLHKQVLNQNKILEEKVRERTKELRDTRLQIIRRLGRAVEYKDNETGLHIIRMSRFSVLIGSAAGLDDEASELLLNASPMHDIGKIGIPDQILCKPGKLDPDEWEIMKTHTTIGADLLSDHDSELLKTAHEIALTHHENWDGSGYPQGLKGNDIPLFGRICALSDVFDALTSQRPYKKAWTVEDSVAEIRNGSGKQFDPNLVASFLGILPEILMIREQYADNGQEK